MVTANPPAVLYKYYSPDRLKIFGNWKVRFSDPSVFNDVFETSWPRNPSMSPRDRFRFLQGLGIFCLTEEPDNHLMWVHYAEQHRGFVVGFKTDDPLFSEAGSELRKVQYCACPPEIMPPSREVCFYKDEDWSYEKEWRCVRDIQGDPARDVPFNHKTITEVIIGSKMNAHDVTSLLREFYPVAGFRISDAKINKKSRTLTHQPSRRHLCPTCDGSGYVEDDGTLPEDRTPDDEEMKWTDPLELSRSSEREG
jgi:hypothetical protein